MRTLLFIVAPRIPEIQAQSALILMRDLHLNSQTAFLATLKLLTGPGEKR